MYDLACYSRGQQSTGLVADFAIRRVVCRSAMQTQGNRKLDSRHAKLSELLTVDESTLPFSLLLVGPRQTPARKLNLIPSLKHNRCRQRRYARVIN